MTGDRVMRLTPKFPLALYLIFTIVNLIIHFTNYYHGFLSSTGDYVLYAVKICICVLVIIATSNKEYEQFKGVPVIMKTMIGLDLLEVILSVTITEISTGLVDITLGEWLVIAVIIAKLVLDYFLYKELSRAGKTRKMWLAINIAIVVFTVAIMAAYWIRLIVFALILARFFYSMGILVECYNEDADRKKETFWTKRAQNPLSSKHRIGLAGAAALLIALFLFLCFSKVPGQYTLTNEDGSASVKAASDKLYGVYYYDMDDNVGDVRQYYVTNRMPEWTGFNRTWYGLFNIKTGEKTEPKYAHELSYDADDIAWDYNGHFIDLNGNVVIAVDSSVVAKRAVRTDVFIDFWDFLRSDFRTKHYVDLNGDGKSNNIFGIAKGSDKSLNIDWHEWRVNQGNIYFRLGYMTQSSNQETYFVNHLAYYYSEVNGATGVINDQGIITTEPVITDMMMRSYGDDKYEDCGLRFVKLKGTDNWNVVGLNGKLLNAEKGYVHYDLDAKVGIVTYYKNPMNNLGSLNGDSYHFVTADGKKVEPTKGVFVDYKFDCGDIISVEEIYEENGEVKHLYEAIGPDGTVIFSSDKYTSFKATKNDDGTIDQLQALDGVWYLIDLEGNIIED